MWPLRDYPAPVDDSIKKNQWRVKRRHVFGRKSGREIREELEEMDWEMELTKTVYDCEILKQ